MTTQEKQESSEKSEIEYVESTCSNAQCITGHSKKIDPCLRFYPGAHAILAAYVFKRNFFQRPQNERHCVSCRHVATCLQDMSRKHLSFVTSEGRHFLMLTRHFFVLKKCLPCSTLSQRGSRRCGVSPSIEPWISLRNVSFLQFCMAIAMCEDCNGATAVCEDCDTASQLIRTGTESNLRI